MCLGLQDIDEKNGQHFFALIYWDLGSAWRHYFESRTLQVSLKGKIIWNGNGALIWIVKAFIYFRTKVLQASTWDILYIFLFRNWIPLIAAFLWLSLHSDITMWRFGIFKNFFTVCLLQISTWWPASIYLFWHLWTELEEISYHSSMISPFIKGEWCLNITTCNIDWQVIKNYYRCNELDSDNK